MRVFLLLGQTAERGFTNVEQEDDLAVYCCALVSLLSPLLYGQATGSFSGTVSDNAGAVISGANVRITSRALASRAKPRPTIPDTTSFPCCRLRSIPFSVEAPGFGSVEQKDVRLQVDEQRELNFSLKPASVSTSVEVNATEVAVETSNASLRQVITVGRSCRTPVERAQLRATGDTDAGHDAVHESEQFLYSAASSEAATRGAFSLSVGGSREQSTDWLLDGNDNNQLDEGGIAIFSDIDAIQEFKV